MSTCPHCGGSLQIPDPLSTQIFGMTKRQRDALEFIEKFTVTSGHSPSFEDIRAALNLRSKSGVHRLLSALEERGLIRRLHYRARAIEVIHA